MFYKSGRQWSTVGHIALNGDIEAQSVIFPNVEHGLNLNRSTNISYGHLCLRSTTQNKHESY
jgi:hypothetical protein